MSLRLCILALVIWHANCIFSAPHYIVMCDLSGSRKFFSHYLIDDTIFEKKKVIAYKMCVLIFFYNFCLNNF
jgi:hypothetical protein